MERTAYLRTAFTQPQGCVHNPPPPSIKTFKGAPRVWKLGFSLGSIKKMLIQICRSGVGPRLWNLGFCWGGIKNMLIRSCRSGVGPRPWNLGSRLAGSKKTMRGMCFSGWAASPEPWVLLGRNSQNADRDMSFGGGLHPWNLGFYLGCLEGIEKSVIERLHPMVVRSPGTMELAWKAWRNEVGRIHPGVGHSPGTMEIAWKALRKVWLLKGFIQGWAAALEPWKLLGRH